MTPPQRTLRGESRLSGVGLHTGAKVTAVFRPAPANSGIRFFRSDLPDSPMIPARLAFVVDTHRGTTLSLDPAAQGAAVHTVEHVLSAATGLGVDNLDVLLDGPEPPAADGSSLPFVSALLEAGIVEQDQPKRTLAIPEPVRYEAGQTTYVAEPSDRFEVDVTLEHHEPVALKQSVRLAVDLDSYSGQVAPARTFAFEHELEYLRAHGLSKGGSLENAIVIGRDGKARTTKEGLRFPDEFVRHKVLDLIGDLTLVGRSLVRLKITARRCGHTHNIRFARLLDEAAARLRRPAAAGKGSKEKTP